MRCWFPHRCLQIALSALVLLCSQAAAQITELRPFDLLAGIGQGQTRLTIQPPQPNDTLKPFDGNPNADLLVTGSDSLVITLEFTSPVRLQASRVFFMSNGAWSLEAAASLGDLDSRTGSFSVLIPPRRFSYRSWDSIAFPPVDAMVLRLRARDSVYSYFDLGEWTLLSPVTFTRLAPMPYPLKIIPGGTMKLGVALVDDHGNITPYDLKYPIDWSSANSSVASIDPNGNLTGVALGATAITVSTEPVLLSGSSRVDVLPDFSGDRVATMTVHVALALIDPVLQQYDARLHTQFHFRDPVALANGVVKYFRQSTDSVVSFVIDTVLDVPRLYSRLRGSYLSVDQYAAWLSEPNWPTLKALQDSIKFDYRSFVTDYHLDSLRNAGRIDEVWVFAGPFMGMWESQLMGPNAFWWNSPPIRDGTALRKLLSVMGLNYERGVDLAFHSFGHRFESAMVQAYQEAQGRPWNDTSAHPTPWDLFTRIDRDVPGGAHVGNVHFPPNGAHDYDYGNTALVTSYAQNWFRYPYLYSENSQVNASTWIYKSPEPLAEGLDQLGYLWWFYNHAPRYRGVQGGVLNNWWHYFLDYDGAVALAKQTPPLGVAEEPPGRPAGPYGLEQNYPNPFNPRTTIAFTVPAAEQVSLSVYDILGRRVATLLDSPVPAGLHVVQWDARNCASGFYVYRFESPTFVQSRKMLLLK